MMPRIVLTLLFFLSFYFELKASIDVELRDVDPNYGRLQTIARLKYAEGINAAYYKDYKGMEVVFETRDNVTKRLAWAGKVSFKPERQNASPVYELDSQVIISYIAHPNYFQQDRNYSTVDYGYIENEEDRPLNVDQAGDPIAANRSPFIIHNLPYTFRDPTSNTVTSHYKSWLHENSIFEWTLGQVYTITDMINMLDSLKINRKFPKYLLYGYSSDGECLNCVTFSSALLQRVGVNLGLSPTIDGYLRNYLHRTWWGATTSFGKAAITVVGAGGLGWIGAQKGTELGFAFGGPIGAVGGAVVGGVVGYFVVGTVVKKISDRQSNIRNAATPELFIEEIYNNKTPLHLRIIRTKRNGGIRPQPFKDVGILDILNRKRWFSLDTLAPDCVFADYGFNY